MRINLQYKISFIFGIIFALVLSLIFIYLDNNLGAAAYQRIKNNLLKETSLVKSIFEEKLIFAAKAQRIDEITDIVAKDLGLRITIIDIQGRVLGDSELDGQALMQVENHLLRPEVQDALTHGIGESKRFSHTIKKDLLYIAMPFGKDKPQGVVRLSVPLSEINLISSSLKRLLIVSLVFALILTIIIGFIASFFISRPIKEIARAAKSIARGDFTKRALVGSNDEISELARAFNYMAEQIQTRIEEVTASKSRSEAVLLSMFDGVMVVDSAGSIIFMNETLKKFLLIKEASGGKKPLEIIRNLEIQEIADNALKLKQGVISREVSLLLPAEKMLLIHATPIIKEKRIQGAVLVFHDITELRRLERMRKDFVANVSHELRTPVSSIKGYAETLLEGALEDKENAKDFLKIIYSDSDRLAKLIDDLLDLSRIESGKLKLVLEPCAIEFLIKKVVCGFKKQLKLKSIKVSIDIPEGISKVLADENRIAQVLLNLIDNAVKYNREQGEINISLKEKDKFIQVDISDTGLGIPDKDLPRLFERFYRIDKARSRELGGTGLGLSIVKHIVQAHNGEVFVRSIFGQGSTFSFTIPKAS